MQAKNPFESKVSIIHEALPEDANAQGSIHGGVVMKLMDAAAGVVSRRHCRKNVVTARVDSLEFLSPVYIGDLIIVKAILTYTGRTSMEIKVNVESENMIMGKRTATTSAFLHYGSDWMKNRKSCRSSSYSFKFKRWDQVV